MQEKMRPIFFSVPIELYQNIIALMKERYEGKSREEVFRLLMWRGLARTERLASERRTGQETESAGGEKDMASGAKKKSRDLKNGVKLTVEKNDYIYRIIARLETELESHIVGSAEEADILLRNLSERYGVYSAAEIKGLLNDC